MAPWAIDVHAGTGLTSADAEAHVRFRFRRGFFDRLTHHRIHLRKRRAMLQPFGKMFDGVRFTDSKHFDAPIGKIAGVAAQAQRVRLRAGVR
jgi:hypothetical protein